MKFHLVDRIEEIEPGKRIVTRKALSLAEEYLADHFPTYPVLPGVLMLEALTQSAAWLTRVRQNFSRSIVVLRAAKNVRYASFIRPGETLRCEVDAMSIGEDEAKFKGAVSVADRHAVRARLELRCFNLAENRPSAAELDEQVLAQVRRTFELIGGPEAMAAAANGA